MAGALHGLCCPELVKTSDKESGRFQQRFDDCEHRFSEFCRREDPLQWGEYGNISKHASAQASLRIDSWNGALDIDKEWTSKEGFSRRRDGNRHTEIDKINIVSRNNGDDGYGCNDARRANAAELVRDNSRKSPPESAILAFPYAENGKSHETSNHDIRAYVVLLRTCTVKKNLPEGCKLHDIVLKRGLFEQCSDALITMYAKCGALAEAEDLLFTHNSRDVISWTALISGYAQRGYCQDALDCYERMQQEGLSPDEVTFSSVLKACGNLGAEDVGRQIHNEIAKQGLLRKNIILGTALVDMYAKFGALSKAQRVLEELPSRSVICWNALIAGYAQHSQGEQALICFRRMQGEGLSPSTVTFTCILSACGSVGDINMGRQIHNVIAKRRLLKTDIVLGNALIDMYVKCGDLVKAKSVLEELPFRNVISWSALITGYAQNGEAVQAFDCFQLMLDEGISPNDVTFSSILKACGTLGAAEKGKQIHDEILRQGLLRSNLVLGNALVDMYVKCGDLLKAQQVLEELPSRDVYSWNALIAGYAQQGKGLEVLTCFECMQCDAVPPDVVTFSCVLNACNHLGLVEDGYNHFVNMSTKHGVKPDLEIYICMIDLLGRAGNLEKVVALIQEIPSSSYSAVWHAVLCACRKWGNVNVGRWAFDHAIEVDKSNGAAYVLMANTYAAAGMHINAKEIEAMMIGNKAWNKRE